MAMKSAAPPKTQSLLIATHNPGKIAEYRLLLADLPLQVVSLEDLNIDFEAPETGDTFAANAQQKATAYAHLSGIRTWADDSGLEVDALDGRPGVLSARYGGDGLSDRERYLRLLDELQGVPKDARTSRFRCAVCIASPDGVDFVVEDSVEGVINQEPVGTGGFGFDPVFYLPAHGVTMAELPSDVKNRISHRGKAASTAKQKLAVLLGA
jgi:XTP/dITP diphosphohydrolase